MTTTSTAASCGHAASSPSLPDAQSSTAPSSGSCGWVVERTFAWLHQFRRLRLRWERRPELHQAFMHLACAFICQRFLRAL
jgi:Transposase DDE domain